MLRFLILWASLVLSVLSHAQTVHISHCLRSCPEVSHPQNKVVVRHLYAAAIDHNTGMTEWVAYRVLKESVGVASLLPRWWQTDSLLDTDITPSDDRATPAIVQSDITEAQDREYRINEIRLATDERGRLTPMTSFAGTPYWDELNNLSNMSPLPAALRLGSWSRLDQAINELAQDAGQLYVVSGPVYSYSATGMSEPQLPSSYFKIVTDGEQIAAFRFSDTLPPHAHHCDQISSLEQIESQLDRQLLPAAPGLVEGGLIARLGCIE